MNRRQFLTTAALAPAALLASDAPAPDLPLSEIAWQRVAESQRSEWYQSQGWKEPDVLETINTRQRADNLRWTLSQYHVYPLVCFPELPIHKAKRPGLEANRRAALVAMIEQMTGPDLCALFEMAVLFDAQPLDETSRLALAALQRKHQHPWGWEEGCNQ